MKFGFGFVPKMPLKDTLRIVQDGEALGFDKAWVPDQTFFRDPFLTLAYWAQETSRIELMLGVTNPYTRHPAQVARAMATLNEIAGGRANLGIGAGNRRELLLPMGQEQTAAAERCREMAVIIRNLLRGETTRHRSEYVIADGIKLEWEMEQPNVPIYIAARGGLTLEAAGEVADGAIIGALVSEAGLDYALSAVERGAAKVGRSISEVKLISWVTLFVTDDFSQAEPRMKASIAHIIGGAPIPLLKTIGLEDEYISTIKAAYAEGGQEKAAQHVTPREIDMLSIVGDANTIIAKLEYLSSKGINEVGILLNEKDAASTLAVIERIAKEIIPHFR
jgi:5,10-methylenetetrahydromethanopterin reductase